jgi:hypothetical protein
MSRLSFVFFIVLSLPFAARAQSAPSEESPHDVAGFVLEITGGTEVGFVPPGESRWQLGDHERRTRYRPNGWGDSYPEDYWLEPDRRTPVIGPLGALRLFAGVGLRVDGSVRLALGYAGQVAFGVEQPDESDAMVVLQRHGFAFTVRSDAFAMSLMVAYVRATFVGEAPGDLDGVALEIDPGFVVDGFTLRFPIGADVWSERGESFPTFHAGLALGGSLL